jgi:dTDP-3-amino-3,4,6-trideoxy-alpha-D-glucose transaminase
MDPEVAAASVTSRTAAIMPVHLFGHPADCTALRAVGDRYGLPIIEDAAQAHGALDGGRRAGTLGTAAGFSFYPTKNLGAFGDGGAVVTNDRDVADKVRLLRNYGSVSKYRHDILGVNSRLDEFQAAILRVKLRHLDAWNLERSDLARQYIDGCAVRDFDVICPRPKTISAWHLLVIRCKERDALAAHLEGSGIGTLIHYPIPPHRLAAYASGVPYPPLPFSEKVAQEALSLPLFPGMTIDEVNGVFDAIDRAGVLDTK